jgi:hypothetical protein
MEWICFYLGAEHSKSGGDGLAANDTELLLAHDQVTARHTRGMMAAGHKQHCSGLSEAHHASGGFDQSLSLELQLFELLLQMVAGGVGLLRRCGWSRAFFGGRCHVFAVDRQVYAAIETH